MVWFKFLLCLIIILFAGTKLARYADAIAEKTGLGGIWVGLVLLAAITSMPELVTGVSAAAWVGLPDLAMGNLLGSCLFNLAIIGLMDILYRPGPVLSQASPRHVASAVGGILLIAIAAGGILGERLFGLALGWVGISSIVIIIVYFVAVRLLFGFERRYRSAPLSVSSPKYEESSTEAVWLKFSLVALAVIGAGIWLSFVGDEIAETYGWGPSFVGSLFLAISTSAPELAVSIAALRIGAVDMAIADVLGSNMFNMALIFPVDIAYRQAPVLSSVSPEHLVTAVVAIVMSLLVIAGLRFRQKRKTLFVISWYGVALIGLYIFGAYALFIWGAGVR